MSGKLRIGYVGVGLMGLPMAKRLLSLGYTVRAYDIAPPASLRRATRAQLPPRLPPTRCAVRTSSSSTCRRRRRWRPRCSARTASPRRCARRSSLIDFSTIKVSQCKAFARRLREMTGAGWIDAPVSGGPPASGSGTLTVMAGGEAADIERARPLFADVAGRFTHMGPTGAGMATKMLNQLIVGAGHAVMAEAVVLAEAAGIDPARLPECLAGGLADSALLQKLYPRMVKRDFAPQGYVRQLLKDLEMVNEFAGAPEGADADDERGADAVPDARAPRPHRARHGGPAQAL